jgi:hypothetical protein
LNDTAILNRKKRRTLFTRLCRCDSRLERCACRSHPPKRRRASLRASVSSDRSAQEVLGTADVMHVARSTSAVAFPFFGVPIRIAFAGDRNLRRSRRSV